MRKARILVVDDEHLIRWSLEQNLKKQGYEIITAGTGEDAVRIVREDQPDLVLLDIQLPGMNGIEVLKRIKEFDDEVSVIMVTAHGAMETAVVAMRLGAYDYINKPLNLDEMAIVIRKALETSALRREVTLFRTVQMQSGAPSIVGESRQMRHILEIMDKVARSEATTILVQGESGTGKELVANWIHHRSARAEKPFMVVNCASVPAAHLERELFGYERDAFADAKTARKGLFELADGGTVFLDEIGDMELGMQAKLLRFLEERSFRRIGGGKVIPVDVRIISATNKDLLKAIEARAFRNDLYYRLQVIPIFLPPLRERGDDILVLARAFLDQYNREFNKRIKGLSPQVEELLRDYAWPGNVRELKNVIERAIILCGDGEYIEHLPLDLLVLPHTGEEPHLASMIRLPPEGISIEEVERELIRQALDLTHGDRELAAEKLHLSPDAFHYRMKKLGVAV